MRKKRNYWTKEICFIEAAKYKTRKELYSSSQRAYNVLRENGWLNEACQHMGKPYGCKYKWTFESCHELALKHKHRKEFQLGEKNAYCAAKYNGWLDEICQHMSYKKLPNKYWHSIENCKNEALKYKTRTEFTKEAQHVYNVARKNGWLDEICQHMILIGDRYNKCVYAHEFSDNHVYVGLTYNISVREKSRNKNKGDSVMLHKKKTGLNSKLIQLTEYVPVDDAIKYEEYYLNMYKKSGWKALNRRKTGSIGSSSPVWNINRVKTIALNYNNSSAFKEEESELFSIAKRSGWLHSFYPNEF